jgi:2-hydroxychromene-2-carboxylate isomerase
MPSRPVLYYDLGSPYAYLAVARCRQVLGANVTLQPVLVGAIFAHRGWGSWGDTAERESNMAEVERRARAYGLPSVRWPQGWPNNTLSAMRAAVWAGESGAGDAFARTAFAAAFAEAKDLSDLDVVREVAAAAGLDPNTAATAAADPRIKAELKRVTDEAIADGVGGVPCTRVDGRVFYGDDRLEQAAELLARA